MRPLATIFVRPRTDPGLPDAGGIGLSDEDAGRRWPVAGGSPRLELR